MKIGDWVYCDFELSRIEKMEGYRVTEVTTGAIRHAGHDLTSQCFPLELRIKVISEEYDFYSHKLHSEGLPGLNYPDFHRWLVSHWVGTCSGTVTNDFYVSKRYKELHNFCMQILDASSNFKFKEIDGVRLGRV